MRAVLLEPHPDDAILFSCFNLLRYDAHVVTVFQPDTMAGKGYPGGSVSKATRMFEHARAMDTVGADFTVWPLSDAVPDSDVLADRIGALDCDVLIAPAVEEDGHPDHNMVGSLAHISGARIIQYTTYTRAGGRSRAGREVPSSPSWLRAKQQAMACYESQVRHSATQPWFLTDDLREWVA